MGASVVCNVRWLGLRAKHIEEHVAIGAVGEPLTERDEAVLHGLQGRNSLVRDDERYAVELEKMRALGKHELQCLFGHPDGIRFLSDTFLPTAILQHDYL